MGEVGGGERGGKEQDWGQMAAASMATSQVRTFRHPGGRGKLGPGVRPEPTQSPSSLGALSSSLHTLPSPPMPSDCSALTTLGIPSPPSPQMQP